jgi:hypothetical protein
LSQGQVLDYSGGYPGAKAIKDDGYKGAVRYIGFADRRKCTNATELNDFTAEKIGMALIYENNATEWRGGYGAGQSAGTRARGHANAIGFPRDRPIYYAVDQDVVSSGEFDAAIGYLRGAGSTSGGPGLTGVYGESDLMDRVRDAGSTASWFWQTAAWSKGHHTAANLYQLIGTVTVGRIGCDINDILTDDWGQHITQGVDTMSAADAYNGFVSLLKDMDAGKAPEVKAILQGLVWTTKLSTNSDPSTAESMVAGTAGRVATMQDEGVAVTLTDVQLVAFAKSVSNNLITAGVDMGGVSIDQVVDAVRTVFADAGRSDSGQV